MSYSLKSWTQGSLRDPRIFCDSVKTPVPAEVTVFIACLVGSLVRSTQENQTSQFKTFPSEAKIREPVRVVSLQIPLCLTFLCLHSPHEICQLSCGFCAKKDMSPKDAQSLLH